MDPEQALQFLMEVARRNCGSEPLHRQFYQQAVQVLSVVVQQVKEHSGDPSDEGQQEPEDGRTSK